MDASNFTGAVLYDGEGRLVGDMAAPSLDGPGGLIHTRPVCHLIFDPGSDTAWERTDVDLIYVLPLGSGPHMVVPGDLGAMVAVLDRGGRVAFHGSHVEAVEQAIEAVLSISGGGRA